MKIDTLGPIMDVQPLFEALAEYKDQGGLYTATTKRFLRAKILATCVRMRNTATFVEEQVGKNPIPKKTPRER